jgi:hypothetical protein
VLSFGIIGVDYSGFTARELAVLLAGMKKADNNVFSKTYLAFT